MINELKWMSLTAAVNATVSPNSLLFRNFWNRHTSVPTEDIEIDVISNTRSIAPFVRRGAEGVLVGGNSSTFQVVSAPNIRLKMPFTPSTLLFGRQPGTVIFNPSNQVSAIQQHIARDVQKMADMVSNAEEYLAAMALQGVISYSVADQENITITYPRDSSCNITLTTKWNDATPATGAASVVDSIYQAKKAAADGAGVQITDAILSPTAAATFRSLVVGGYIKTLDQRQVDGGQITFASQFQADGGLYLGTLSGVDFWEYGRTATLNGVSTAMIRDKYVEWIGRDNAAADREVYYGAIPELTIFQGQLFQGERFSKSWMIEDPPAMMSLIHSRPLPVPRRPNASVSMLVNS